MKTFKQFLGEMATPSNEHLSKIYYHGFDNKKNLESIQKNGLVPPIIENPKRNLAPQPGKVYITTELRTAIIYAIGGDMLGHNPPQSWLEGDKKYGYVCLIKGQQLLDILPDEDEVGELIHDKKIPWLNNLAQQSVANSTYKKVMDGQYEYWAKIGKILIKKLNNYQILELINATNNVAHTGNLEVDEIWQFDKSLCKDLKSDGSNFFDLAHKL
jgi:hypothetical protein